MIHALLMSPLPSIWLGRLDEAQTKIQRTRANYPSQPPDHRDGSGDCRIARRFPVGRSGPISRWLLAQGRCTCLWHCAAGAYAICGKPEKAMMQLRRSAECGLPNYKLFSRDPLLRSLTHTKNSTASSRSSAATAIAIAKNSDWTATSARV